MGSGSSRPAASAIGAQSPKRSSGKKKRKEGVLAPFLRSMSCGSASSSWRTESFVQESRMQSGDIVACQSPSKKSIAADLCNEICGPCGLHASVGEKCDNETSGGSSSGYTSTSLQQNSEYSFVFGSGKSTASSLGSENSSSVVPGASYPLRSQRSRNGEWHQAESQANRISRSHGHFFSPPDTDGDIANTDAVSISGANSSNMSVEPVVCEDKETNILGSLGNSSRIQGASGDVLDSGNLPNLPNSGAVEGITGPSQGFTNLGSEESEAHDLQGNSDAHRSENIGVLHIEALGLVAQTLDESSSLSREALGREARRNNRRRLWDVLTRATTRRRRFSPTFLLASEDVDGLGSWNDSWGLYDWNSSEEGSFVEESGFVVRRSSEVDGRRWRSRPQVWALQNFSNSMESTSGHSRHCAFGRHPDGRCSCEAFVMTEESNTRASISRIVMLAEALFEVLDEIHRQSVALSRSTSLSLVSLPAPEAVVDSFPVRMYKKTENAESVLDECAECYICLLEYGEGDSVRTLPCDHEFHMSCVDKWLKEVHRVCPLCRGNVCDATVGISQAPAA